MKISITAIILFLFITPAFSQDLSYYYMNDAMRHSGKKGKTENDVSRNLMYGISGMYKRPVKKEKLNAAKYLNDISPGYPANWIKEYISAEIQSTCNGKSMKALSSNNILTTEQKHILNTVDIGSDIDIKINYKTVNSATGSIDIRTINYSVTLVPESEAAFHGGYQQLVKYLKENAINKIYEINPQEMGDGSVRFTINEQGEIVNSHVFKSCGIQDIDKLLLEVINKMPKWKPAEDSKGVKVKQSFEFTVGNGGC